MAARHTLLAVLAIIFMFPVVYMLVSSLKPDRQLLSDTATLRAFLPIGDISLRNYGAVFQRVPAVQFIGNTIFVSAVTVLSSIVINSMAGFSLGCLNWRGRSIVLSIIIATLILSFETIAVPLLLIVSRLPWIGGEGITTGWLNSYQVQILPFVATAVSIFLSVQYFKSLPTQLIEAARIDGASWFQVYSKVFVPLAGRLFATIAILTFLSKWNDYLWPLMVIQKEEFRPIMVGLQYFLQLNIAWGEIMAYLSFVTIPVLVLFLMLQRTFIASIAATGTKEG